MAGWFPLFAAAESAPNTPVLMITSPVSDSSPEFLIYGEWQNGDVLQFERQAAGGGWASPTVSNHTVTSGEISGSAINLSLSALSAGSYDFRAKYKHASGSYTAYSPLDTVTIDLALNFQYCGQATWSGTGGGTVKTATGVSAGTAFTNRRVFVFGVESDGGGSATVSSLKINGAAATVVQSGTGYDLRWYASALVPTGSTVDLEITYSSGVFANGTAVVYSVDDSLLSSSTATATHHVATSSTTSATSTLTTTAGGVTIILGVVIGSTAAGTSITASDDTFTVNLSSSAYFSASARGTLSRSASATMGWTPARDGYFTSWNFR